MFVKNKNIYLIILCALFCIADTLTKVVKTESYILHFFMKAPILLIFMIKILFILHTLFSIFYTTILSTKEYIKGKKL